MFGAVVFALLQVVDHPAPFVAVSQIAPLYKKFRSADLLMATVVFIEIVFINEKPRRDHIEIASIIDP